MVEIVNWFEHANFLSSEEWIEKDFFKLMNNSLFGKTMENICKHVNVELVTESQKLKKLVAKPTFKVAKQFNEHLMGVSASTPVSPY